MTTVLDKMKKRVLNSVYGVMTGGSNAVAIDKRSTRDAGSSSKIGYQHEHRSVNFKVHNAVGGKVVETNYYNNNTDHETVQLYVIADDANLGEELAKIVTMTYLQK